MSNEVTNRVIEFYLDNIVEYSKLSTDTELFCFIKTKCSIEIEGGYKLYQVILILIVLKIGILTSGF